MRSLISLALFTAATLPALAAPRIAHAQSKSTASQQAAAEALFSDGKRLMAAGSVNEACAKFAESQKLDPGAGTLVNLAACYEKAGKSASAWVTYVEAASEAERTGRKQWETQAKKKREELEPTLSRLTIVVPSAARVAGLRVERDGNSVNEGEWGVAVPMDPGAHVIRASADGREPWQTSVTIDAKKSASTIEVPPLVASTAHVDPKTATGTPPVDTNSPPPLDPKQNDDGSSLRTVSLVLGGVGVVGIGVGAVFGIMALGAKSDAKADCSSDFARCNQAGLGNLDSASSKATVSTISFIAGGTLLAGGVLFYVLAPKSHETTSAWKVTPRFGVNDHGASFGAGGTF